MITIVICLFAITGLEDYMKGDISIRVQVWGEVRSPGIYAVPPTTNLIEAISFAGGPTSRSDLSRVKLVKALKDKQLICYDVKAYMEESKENPPILDSGDLVYIPQSLSSRVWDFTRFLGVVAGITWSIYMVASD